MGDGVPPHSTVGAADTSANGPDGEGQPYKHEDRPCAVCSSPSGQSLWYRCACDQAADGSRLYDGVWRYKSSVNEWTEAAPMLKPREYHSSVVHGALRPRSGLLGGPAPMLHPMDNCSTTTCSGRLYAIGSLTGDETMAIQSYDAESNRWTLVSCGQMPPWSFTPKTVTLKSLIYFIRDDSAEVDVYNPQKNEWDKISPMTQVHVGGSVSALGGKLYVSGGYDNTFELSDVVETFDPTTRCWTPAGRLPQPTFWHGSVSIFRQFMPQVSGAFAPAEIPESNAIHPAPAPP
ncbi:hypothetical protein KUCAC02_012004, partial [Chaenocephalus aceratus]